MKNIDIIGGGTISHVRNHLALAAPAYGNTARLIERLLNDDRWLNPQVWDCDVRLHLTKMANGGQGKLETNEDISNLLDSIIANPDSKIVFFNVALVDYEGHITKNEYLGGEWYDNYGTTSGKYEERLKTSEGEQRMRLTPAAKLISKIRRERKDIFLVGFKTTCGASEDEQFLTGLHLLKTSSCNLVLANDTKTRVNMIITPEQARYAVSNNRVDVIRELVQMAVIRSEGTFTRSTIKPGDPVMWNSELIPSSLREVVNHCIQQGAYKPFNGSTVGHFAVKVSESDFVTSKRKSNYNDLDKVGMVLCHSESPDEVIAYGAKPSVGGQSQRIIFKDHPETDCIVHFHCPPKPEAKIIVKSQWPYECGSHQCGKNTSDGLRLEIPGIKCVFLDNHGPNIVFHRDIDPKTVIEFIDANFDLSKSTDGVDRNKVMVK